MTSYSPHEVDEAQVHSALRGHLAGPGKLHHSHDVATSYGFNAMFDPSISSFQIAEMARMHHRNPAFSAPEYQYLPQGVGWNPNHQHRLSIPQAQPRFVRHTMPGSSMPPIPIVTMRPAPVQIQPRFEPENEPDTSGDFRPARVSMGRKKKQRSQAEYISPASAMLATNKSFAVFYEECALNLEGQIALSGANPTPSAVLERAERLFRALGAKERRRLRQQALLRRGIAHRNHKATHKTEINIEDGESSKSQSPHLTPLGSDMHDVYVDNQEDSTALNRLASTAASFDNHHGQIHEKQDLLKPKRRKKHESTNDESFMADPANKTKTSKKRPKSQSDHVFQAINNGTAPCDGSDATSNELEAFNQAVYALAVMRDTCSERCLEVHS